jgi:RNA polymerase sigma-54 factor
MSLSQSIQQKLLQKLSPQQIQLMKLLQIPTANLEERIKEELEENPALEQGEEGMEDEFSDDIKDEFESNDEPLDGSEEEYENIDIADYVQDGDDEVGDYKMKDDNYPEMDDSKVLPIKNEVSFYELFINQLGMLDLDERKFKVAEQIVGSLDDDGYLRRELSSIVDDLAFRQNVITNEKEVEALIRQIQQFDPPGIGARDLQECLLIQLQRKTTEGIGVALAIKVLTKYFDEFTKKHYEKIQRGLDLNDEDLKEVITQIIKLNPKPGGNVGEINKAESYIIPDFFMLNNAGILELTLNSRNAPDLRISEGYRDMLKDYDRGSKR